MCVDIYIYIDCRENGNVKEGPGEIKGIEWGRQAGPRAGDRDIYRTRNESKNLTFGVCDAKF